MFDEMKLNGYSIEFIEYDKFKELCIPDMMDRSIMFGIFYNDKREGLAIGGESLLEDLESEEG
jgi:hypothetical protein